MVSNIASTTQLPLPISSFIGRETELKTLQQKLAAGTRLITLVGPGGVGKTRLALELCAREAASFAHGAAFVTLEAISDAEFILPEIARGLSVELSGTASPPDDLTSSLKEKQLLLCVDNWEHLIEAGGQVIPLLAACPNVSLLATSREPLRLRGEQVVWVEPLKLQSPALATGPETAVESQAVQLFVERARAVRLGFELDQRNAASVLEICTLLDGLPLAVELAAALMRLFSPEALLTRMQKSNSFAGRSGAVEMLVVGPRDLPARQQTMRATIEWSYGLLNPDEQRVFRRLAVFAGGCDLEAAEAVCEGDVTKHRPLLDILIVLSDKSLVRIHQNDGEPRFEMMRVILEYAFEQLVLEGEQSEIRERHFNFFSAMAARLNKEIEGADPKKALLRFDLEQENFRTALNWSLENHQPANFYQIFSNLFNYWLTKGHLSEGRQWVKQAFSLEDMVASQLKSDVTYKASILALHQGDIEGSRSYLVECLNLRREIGDLEGASMALMMLGIVESSRNKGYEASLSYIYEGLELLRNIGSQIGVASALLRASWVLFVYCQYDSAEAHVHQAMDMALLETEQSSIVLAGCWHVLGNIAAEQGYNQQAQDWLEKARIVAEQRMPLIDKLQVDCDLGRLFIRCNRLQEAETAILNALTGSSEVKDRIGIVEALDALVCLGSVQSKYLVAAQLLGASNIARIYYNIPRLPHDQYFCDHYSAITRTYLGEQAFLSACKRGEAMNIEQAVEFAIENFTGETFKQSSKPKKSPIPAGLSAREVEVLRLVARGLSDKEIAEQLVLSPRTVNAHLTSIYSKISVNSRVAATRFAIEHQLI